MLHIRNGSIECNIALQEQTIGFSFLCNQSKSVIHGILRGGEEIEDRSSIQPESPEAVQAQIDNEDTGHHKRDDSEITLPDTA